MAVAATVGVAVGLGGAAVGVAVGSAATWPAAAGAGAGVGAAPPPWPPPPIAARATPMPPSRTMAPTAPNTSGRRPMPPAPVSARAAAGRPGGRCSVWPQEPQKVTPSGTCALQCGQRSAVAAAGAATGVTGTGATFTVWPQEPQKTAPLGRAAPQRGHAWPPAGGPADDPGIARVGGSGGPTGCVGGTGDAGAAGDGTGVIGGSGTAGGAGGCVPAGRSTWPQAPQKPAVSSTAAPQWGQAISMGLLAYHAGQASSPLAPGWDRMGG